MRRAVRSLAACRPRPRANNGGIFQLDIGGLRPGFGNALVEVDKSCIDLVLVLDDHGSSSTRFRLDGRLGSAVR
jgi:hypothetical protein